MARAIIVAFSCLAILVACVDDSIAAGTVTMDDDYAAALDNDYLLGQPTTPQLVERHLQVFAGRDNIFISSKTSKRAAAAHFRSEPCDVSPLIMRC